jgi:hypothetical protein
MDLDRAKVISEVAQTIINTAMVEVQLVKAVSGSAPGSRTFFNMPEESRELRDERIFGPKPKRINGGLHENAAR